MYQAKRQIDPPVGCFWRWSGSDVGHAQQRVFVAARRRVANERVDRYDARAVKYLAHYPAELRARVEASIDGGQLGAMLAERYPSPHEIQSNAALYRFAMAIKRAKMTSSKPLSKVRYCDKISTLNNALGLHTYETRVQGANELDMRIWLTWLERDPARPMRPTASDEGSCRYKLVA